MPLILLLLGRIDEASWLWQWGAPIVSGIFLALTGGLLLADLEHPKRFYMIFTRPQWGSWLVRGAFIIGGYSAILGLHFLASMTGGTWQGALALPGALLAVATAVYTAYLFAQAKARDLWQSPLLPPHLFVQSLLGGSAVLLPVAARFQPETVAPLSWILAITSLTHLLMVAGEITLPHGTAHAALAVHEITSGRFRHVFWPGLLLGAIGCMAPWLAPGLVAAAAALALVGLGLYEHAYVQGGQAVPLA
ncbi:MAG: polysulfide reductase NrfD [Acidobacteria bacterium]|nr:polysulfide reductase NrfD [Acidobacteriota bacterium]